jgi:uncharacterized coiled-coil DUF342 family protein
MCSRARENIHPLTEKLAELTQKLPDNIKAEFTDTNKELAEKLKAIEDATVKATEPVQKQIRDLTEAINELVNKPTSKGKAGEKILSERWQETFIKDKIELKGGPGQSDLIIVPYLSFNGGVYGEKIVVERKAGKQK